MFDFLLLKKSISDIGASARKLDQDIETKKQQRDQLESAPISRKELADQLGRLVERQARDYPETLRRALAGLTNKPFYDFENSHMNLVLNSGGGMNEGKIPKQNLHWFFMEQIKSRLSDAVMAENFDWPDSEVGAPLQERRALIEKLDKEISTLENQREELTQQAAAAGIRL